MNSKWMRVVNPRSSDSTEICQMYVFWKSITKKHIQLLVLILYRPTQNQTLETLACNNKHLL